MATRIGYSAAAVMADNFATNLNAGSISLLTGQSAAGGQPSDVADGDVSVATLLATFTLGDPAFANSRDAAPGALVSANAIAAVSALTSGVARFFRAYTSASVAVIDGACGSASDSNADMTLNNIDIDQDQLITINTWSITIPQSAA